MVTTIVIDDWSWVADLKRATQEANDLIAMIEADQPRTVDFFCGGGGYSAGARTGGCKVVAGFEWDSDVCAVAQTNHDHDIIETDIGAIGEVEARRYAEIYRPDYIHGSPPCQDFSPAGKGQIGERAELTYHFAEVAAYMRPRIITMENSTAIYSKGRSILDRAEAVWREAGYGIRELVLDARSSLAPTARKRAVVFAVSGVSDEGLKVLERHLFHRKALPCTLRDRLGDLGVGGLYHHRWNGQQRHIIGLDEPYPTIRAQQGHQMPRAYEPRPGDACPPEAARAPTWEEYQSIQTFPADWQWPDPPHLTPAQMNRLKMRVLGNSVPPNMAHDIAWTAAIIWRAMGRPRWRG